MSLGVAGAPNVHVPFLKRRSVIVASQVILGIAIIALWELFTVTGTIKPLALPEPWRVATYIGDMFRSGIIWGNLGATLLTMALGFLIAVVAGTIIGVLCGTVPVIRFYLSPVLAFFNGIPRLILIPIFVVWLGIGYESQVIVVVLYIVFLIAVTVQAGIAEIQGVLVLNARTLGASWFQLVQTVYLPGVSIWIVSVARQCIGHAFAGAVVTEFFGAPRGLGWLINDGLETFNSREIWAAILITSAFAFLGDSLLKLLDRRVSRYLG